MPTSDGGGDFRQDGRAAQAEAVMAQLGLADCCCVALPGQFVDATHWVFECSCAGGQWVVKMPACASSPFWQVMQRLFACSLPQAVSGFPLLYAQLASMTPLQVPELLSVVPFSAEDAACVVTGKLPGRRIEVQEVTPLLVQQLAVHMAALHGYPRSGWGNWHASQHDIRAWQLRLRSLLAEAFPGESVSIAGLQTQGFVPWMADLRWDQFLADATGLSAVVDLDAFVIAPMELDLVLLEYVLTAEQLPIWQQAYVRAGGRLPPVAPVRGVYRRLLWLMQVMGDVDPSRWLSQPEFFA